MNQQARHYGAVEWGLTATVAVAWGTAFLMIAVGIEAFAPGIIAFGRLALGTLTVALFPAARRPVQRSDWRGIVFLGVVWMAIPLVLFPIAEQWVASSVAGMLNGAMPVATTAIAAGLARRRPARRQTLGIALGFTGVIAITGPSAFGEDASLLGVGLILVAVGCYAVGANVAAPLQRRNGALPVTLRALFVASVVTLPVALIGLPSSTFAWNSFAAVIVLGIASSGISFMAFVTLIGRAGADRASVAVFFVPVVALAVGVAFNDESVAALAVFGVALVIFGAWLSSTAKSVEPAEGVAATGAEPADP